MINKQQENNVVIYAIYTLLYANDMACECIDDLDEFVKDKDKETRKIYGALKKRKRAYKSSVNRIIGDEIPFWSDLNYEYDVINDKAFQGYRKAIDNIYKRNGIKDHEYLSYVEMARSMVEMANWVIDSLVERIEGEGIKVKHLLGYRLTEVHRVMENFADWAYHNVKTKNTIVLNEKKSVMSELEKIQKNILRYENFEKAYNTACKKNAK